LLTDTCIFILTLWRARQYFYISSGTPLLRLFMRDGVVYFAVIFCVNLMNVLTYLLASADLSAIGAAFSQLITSTMISRLVLNLRSNHSDPAGVDGAPPVYALDHSTIITRGIGFLGDVADISNDRMYTDGWWEQESGQIPVKPMKGKGGRYVQDWRTDGATVRPSQV